MKKILIFSIVIWFSGILVAQTNHTYNYQYSDSIFNNPERGFYRYTERADVKSSLNVITLKSYRDVGYTLIYRIFYMRDFVNKPISQAYLDKIKEDFGRMREAGVKGVIRFAYTSSMSAPYGDATPEQVKKHLKQLKPILTDNSDVILILQAGFIGAWGEWFYTDYFANPDNPDKVSEANMTDRKNLVLDLLDAIPADRMIQLRYVGYKMKFFDSIPLTLSEAYSGSPKSRISHHNDCFVSSGDDVGSYKNIKLEKDFLDDDTKYTSIGGETCDWYQLRSNCDTSLFEMARFHWSFINEDYYGQTIKNWKNDGCYGIMSQKLGYRYTIVNANIQDSTKLNSSFYISFTIKNTGFSNPINPRSIEIVLRNKATGKLFYSPINFELRKCELNTNIKFSTQIGIPSSMIDGDYEVYLNLPDPKNTIKNRPEFSIRLANENVWNNSLGMNSFVHTLHVNKNSSGKEYTGSNFFLTQADNISPSLDAPRLTLSSFCKNAIVSFAPTEQDTNSLFVIERSTNANSGFLSIAALSVKNGIVYYKDNELDVDKTYYYRAYCINNDQTSKYSETKSITTESCNYKYPNIVVDTLETDWNAIPPVAAVSKAKKDFFLKTYMSNTDLNILLKGDSIDFYSVYFDADNNSLTGENNSNWANSGFEYRFSVDSIFSYKSGSYTFISKMDSFLMNLNMLEYKIPLELLNINNSTADFRFSALVKSNGNTLLMPFNSSSLYERVLPASTITNFAVRQSATIPTRLIATWDKCMDCDGYVLIRTDESSNTQTHFELLSTENQLIDEGLTNNALYSYSIYAYNFSGKSDVSEPFDISTNINDYATDNEIIVWPNPATDELHIKIVSDNYTSLFLNIYSLDGILVYTKKLSTMNAAKTLDLSIPIDGFNKGIYFMHINLEKSSRVIKIICY